MRENINEPTIWSRVCVCVGGGGGGENYKNMFAQSN